MLRRVVSALLALAVAVPAIAFAVVEFEGEDPAATLAANADRRFVAEAGRDGLAASGLARMVRDRSGEPRMVTFAREVLRDHETATERLRRIARSRDLPFPDDPAEKLQRPTDDLAPLDGAAFDRAYLQHLVDTHARDTDLLQRYAEAGDDPELRLWAADTVPMLQRHLQQARSLLETLGA